MNKVLLAKVTLSAVLTTVFFSGIIVSAGSLYLLWENSPVSLMVHTIIFSVTLTSGVISLCLAAFSKKQTIVYLEKPKEEEKKGEVIKVADDMELLQGMEALHHQQNSSPQQWINSLCSHLQAGQGAIYTVSENTLELKYGYAMSQERGTSVRYEMGESLIGRVAAEGKSLYIDDLPEKYITVFSGLGAASPGYLFIFPIRQNNRIQGVVEVATFSPLSAAVRQRAEALVDRIAIPQSQN